METRKVIRWLQLSDLHIFYSTEWEIMLNSYKELSTVFKPDFIVVTGDFCHKVKNGKYDAALKFLNSLSEIFSLGKENFFFVPGNHDADDFAMRDEIITTIRGKIEDDPDVYQQYCASKQKNLHRAFKRYCTFVNDFYGDLIDDDRVKNPSGIYAIPWNDRVNIIALNTALISNGDVGRYEIVDIKKFSQIANQIDKSKPTIVLAHHDFHALAKSQGQRLERLLSMVNARAYLCGDEHKLRREIANKYDIENQIPCIICGKSAVETGDNYSDVCVIGYTWEGNKTRVEVFKWLSKEADTPFQFIRSDTWFHHIDKPYTFKMTDDHVPEAGVTEKMEATWKDFLVAFEAEDQLIYEKLNGNKIRNKTNNVEKFSSAKIMASLIKIGIPFPAIAEITRVAIDKLIEWIDSHGSSTPLDTKTVREFVLEAIKTLGDRHWPTDDVGKWHAKYIRRYGHNNKTVEIYNIPAEVNGDHTITGMTYRFIKEVFLPDLFKDISPSIDIQLITNSQKTNLADEIISFINGCDLYRIDYTVLKRMMYEIATQPPHPWLVNETQRAELINYDKDAVASNLQKVKEYEEAGRAVPHIVLVELLHHTSAMILDKYFSFCGCEDLDSFNILYQYLKKMIKAALDFTKWDKVLSDGAVQRLYHDFRINGIDLTEYYETVCALNPCKVGNIATEEYMTALKSFTHSSLVIVEELNNIPQTIIEFTHNSWNSYSQENINYNIAIVLSLLFPFKYFGDNPKLKSVWWLRYLSCFSSVFPTMKSSIFTVVLDEKPFEEGTLSCLAGDVYKEMCNTIFFIKEQYPNKKKCYLEINAMLRRIGLDSYTPVLMDKSDLNRILTCSGKKNICFDRILEKQNRYKL